MIINQALLLSEIKEIILQSRQRVFRIANSALPEAYLYMPKEEDLKALIESDIQRFELDKEN